MKFKIIYISLFICFTKIYSQTEKGQIQMGGSFFGSFTNTIHKPSTNVSSMETFEFTISPEIGYFVWDNFSILLNPLANYSQTQFTLTESKYSHNSYGLNVGINKYFGQSDLKPIIGASGGISYELNHQNTFGSASTSEQNFGLSGYTFAGLAYFFNPKVSIKILTYYYYSNRGSTFENSLNLKTHNFVLGTGFSYFL